MTNKKGEISNPEDLPVENVVIEVKDAGVVRHIPALDTFWVEERELSLYEKPPSCNDMVIGELEAWKAKTEAYIEDLKWLLSLEYHRFWSTVIYHPKCMDFLVSFLQEGNPPYIAPHENEDIWELYGQVRRFVLVVFCRLITNKESKSQWMTKEYMSNLIYNRFIFTIPIMLDLCLMYGYDNGKLVSKIVSSVFELQSQYQKDAVAAFSFINESFKFVILQVNKNYNCPDPPNLPETFKGFGEIRRPDANRQTDKLTFEVLRDLVLHVLDTAMTVRMFVQAYPKSVDIIKKANFVNSMVQIYEFGIPQFYEKLTELCEETNMATAEVEEFIDLARAEIIDIFREILAVHKNVILAREGNTALQVEEYLTVMMEGLSEKLLIQDYHACYPVHEDLEILRQAFPDILSDSVKTDFILQAIYSNLDEDVPQHLLNNDYETNGYLESSQSEPGPSNNDQSRSSTPTSTQSEADMEQALIKEVKDVLPHLGEGFILKCLKHYAYSPSKVISAVLEDNLAEPLKGLDQTLPIIPEDRLDNYYLETGVQRLNVFDGDEFDIMTRDDVDLSKIHVGKKRPKYKDLTEMLNDKSEIKKRLDIYHKYSVICDEEERGLYSDEYDDTYDSDVPVPVGERDDPDARRPLCTPRVLGLGKQENRQEESDSSEEEPDEEKAGPSGSRLDFCVNPELLRAKREAAFQARRAKGKGPPPKSQDVAGKPRGQGQEKEVLVNRDKKEKHKSARANHNRRQGAQWKRSQGMMPS